MDHQHFVKSLSAEERNALTQTSNARGLLHLAGHVGAIAIMGACITLAVPFWWVLLLPYGVSMVFLFTLQHETTHRTPFANLTLNDWVGRMCGVVMILPFEWFRYFHLAHHKHTNDPDNDPELAGEPVSTGWGFVVHVSGIPNWAENIRQTAANAMGLSFASYVPTKAKGRIKREARIMVAIYVLALSTLLVSDALIWLWIVPGLLGQPFLRLYLMAEHGRCPPVANMFENTRTTFTNQIVRFFAWNMPFHAEHHALPSVPFWQLPMLHERTQLHLKTTSDGYTEFTRETIERL